MTLDELAEPQNERGAPSLNPPPPTEQAMRVLRQFRMVFSAMRRHFQAMEKQTGIGGAQIWALSLIADHPGMGINALAAAMDIHQSTTSNLVRSLTSQGLVQADKASTDKRVVELYALPAGQKVLRKVPRPHAGLLPQALGELDGPTLAQLELHLAKLIDRLQVVDTQAARTPLALM